MPNFFQNSVLVDADQGSDYETAKALETGTGITSRIVYKMPEGRAEDSAGKSRRSLDYFSLGHVEEVEKDSEEAVAFVTFAV